MRWRSSRLFPRKAFDGVFGLTSLNANATVRVGHTLLTGNTTGVTTSGTSTLLSYADNNIDGNTGGNGPLTTIVKK